MMNDVINDQNKNIEDIDFADFEELQVRDKATQTSPHRSASESKRYIDKKAKQYYLLFFPLLGLKSHYVP